MKRTCILLAACTTVAHAQTFGLNRYAWESFHSGSTIITDDFNDSYATDVNLTRQALPFDFIKVKVNRTPNGAKYDVAPYEFVYGQVTYPSAFLVDGTPHLTIEGDPHPSIHTTIEFTEPKATGFAFDYRDWADNGHVSAFIVSMSDGSRSLISRDARDPSKGEPNWGPQPANSPFAPPSAGTLTFSTGSDSVFITSLKFRSYNPDSGVWDQVGIDNMSIAVVPEPSSALLLGISSIALWTRRRRR